MACVILTGQLMLFNKANTSYSENYVKEVRVFCGQNAECLNVEDGRLHVR